MKTKILILLTAIIISLTGCLTINNCPCKTATNKAAIVKPVKKTKPQAKKTIKPATKTKPQAKKTIKPATKTKPQAKINLSRPKTIKK